MAVAELIQTTSVSEALDLLHRGGVHTRYENFIGGRWSPPAKGKYFTDKSPINSETIAEIARSSAEDVETALDAAHAAKNAWSRTSPAVRASILNKVADRIEENLDSLPSRKLSTTASLYARPEMPTSRSLRITSAISRLVFAVRKAQSAKSTTTPSHTISKNR